MILPRAKRHSLGIRSHSGEKPKSGWGTRIHLKKYSLGQFFKKRNLPLTETYYPAEYFKSPRHLKKFIEDGLKTRNDLLTCFNYPLLYSEDGVWGHASLIEKINTNHVALIDPGRKYKQPRKVKIDDLFMAIKNHFGGGIWLIKAIPVE
ncbi:hypothetical protein KKI17_00815 [Patescibacteria group bacterium]|nr:hypothetical protein [Patescibacteria group bacterium]